MHKDPGVAGLCRREEGVVRTQCGQMMRARDWDDQRSGVTGVRDLPVRKLVWLSRLQEGPQEGAEVGTPVNCQGYRLRVVLKTRPEARRGDGLIREIMHSFTLFEAHVAPPRTSSRQTVGLKCEIRDRCLGAKYWFGSH